MPSSDDLPPSRPPSPATPAEQLQSLQHLQDQAEERVKLGLQFFQAAEAQTAEHRRLIEELHAERDQLRQEVQEDVAKSLHAYDQWVGQIDESFTKGLRNLEGKMDKLEDAWAASQQRIAAMLQRSEAMLNQTRSLLARIDQPDDDLPAPHPAGVPGAESRH